jgi:hypothetical protein
MWFMQDIAPAHFSRIARKFLNNNYTNTWISRRGPIAWPARSPDLNPLDFYLWGYLKTIVLDTPVATVEVLQNRIIAACEKCEILREFFNVFDNLCDVGVKHALMRKEIISSNFCKINKICL